MAAWTDKREFVFHDTTDINAVREEFLPQYYLDGENIPRTIAVDALPPDAEALNEALNQARGTKVELYVPQRGDVAKLVTMAYTNAVERLGRESGRYTPRGKAAGGGRPAAWPEGAAPRYRKLRYLQLG